MLILVRHGRTRANALGELLGRRDPDLDDVGRRQALSIAESLVHRPSHPGGPLRTPDSADTPRSLVVISSPLVRCTQTAQAICDRVAGPTAILVDERFIEMDYGELEGTAVADVPAEVWQRWRADPSWRPIGGESLVDVSARVDEALRDLVSSTFPTGSEMGDDVVIVTHVSPIKAALGWVLGIGPDISWRCHVAQASVHRIDPGGPVPRLVSFNETHHLVS